MVKLRAAVQLSDTPKLVLPSSIEHVLIGPLLVWRITESSMCIISIHLNKVLILS